MQNSALTWTGAPTGTLCQVQWASALSSLPGGTVWTTLKTVLVTNTTMTVDVQPFSTAPSRFYRLVGEPPAQILLRHSSGSPGSANSFTGYGYAPGEYVYIYYNGSYVGYGTADSNGACSGNFTTPYYNTPATYSVAGTGQSSGLSASASFNQNAGLVNLFNPAGVPGSANTAYAYGFSAGEYVYLYYNGSYVGYGTASANGYCSISFTTPYYYPRGTYNVVGTGQTSAVSGSTPFNQNGALLSLNSSSGAPGSLNTAYAYGYAAGEYVYAYYNGSYVGYGTAAANGFCSISYTTPYYNPHGTYDVVGAGQTSGLSATNSFNQNTGTLSLNSSSGAPGSANTVYAYGYAAGEYVYIYYNGSYVGYGTAAANGYCSAAFTTPYYNPRGTYTVTGVGQTSTISASTSFNQNAALLSLAGASGQPGSGNTAYGYGYTAGEYVYVYYNGSYVGYGTAAANGYCSATFTTPYYNPRGTYAVTGVGQTSALSAYGSFNQNAALLSLASASGSIGSANTAYGYGYAVGEYVYFYYRGSYVGYGTAASSGYCALSFTIPGGNAPGTYSVTGVGQTSGLSASQSFNQN